MRKLLVTILALMPCLLYAQYKPLMVHTGRNNEANFSSVTISNMVIVSNIYVVTSGGVTNEFRASDILTNNSVTINGSALGNGTNLTITGGTGIDGGTATDIVHNVTDGGFLKTTNDFASATNAIYVLSTNAAYTAAKSLTNGIETVASSDAKTNSIYVLSTNASMVAAKATFLTNNQAGVTFSGTLEVTNVVVLGIQTNRGNVVVTGTITSSVMGCASLTLPGSNAVRNVAEFPLSGLATNTYRVGDLMLFNGTNWIPSAGVCVRNGGYAIQGNAWDYDTNNVPTNNTIYYLDLSLLTNADGSAAVPTGSKYVMGLMQAQGPTVNNYAAILAASNSASVVGIARVQVASIVSDSCVSIALPSGGRALWFQSSGATNWVRTRFKVTGAGY